MSRSSIYKMMQNGEFPRPVRIGPAVIRWRTCSLRSERCSKPKCNHTRVGEVDKSGGPPGHLMRATQLRKTCIAGQ